MQWLTEICAQIHPIDPALSRHVESLLDDKTKPRGSLGLLENLACRLGAIYGNPKPAFPAKAVVVMAADHGVVEEGVSAYPAEVTAQMLRNFAQGGAAINVLARQAGAQVIVVDMGTRRFSNDPLPAGIRDAWLGPGTANFTRGPAMSASQVLQALQTGRQIGAELAAAGVGLIAVGEMGIGNTTAASALTAVFTGASAEQVTGRGTGIDEPTWRHKIATIEKALALHRPRRDQPLDTLAQIGGFELAGLVGVMLGAASRRIPILLDGFITGAAALVAAAYCPTVTDYLIAAHQSVEPGHRILLEYLHLRPLLQLDLRLGEGTGAVLAMPLVDASLLILHEMATFTSAGVTSTGA